MKIAWYQRTMRISLAGGHARRDGASYVTIMACTAAGSNFDFL